MKARAKPKQKVAVVDDDRAAFTDAVACVAPRIRRETLEQVVDSIYQGWATVLRVDEILRVEEDAGVISDALLTARDIIELFEYKGDNWQLKKKDRPKEQPQVVMHTKVGGKALGAKVLGQSKHDTQAKLTQAQLRAWCKSQVHKAQGHTAALDTALGGMARLPKPRSLGAQSQIDETIWQGAMSTAKHEFNKEQDVEDLNKLYSSMCKVSRSLLTQELHRRAQRLYDYRAGKIFSKVRKKGETN